MKNIPTEKEAALVLLTFNEIDGIRRLLDRLPMSTFSEVFAVDGGSTDGTVEYLRKHGIRVIVQQRRGRGDAFRIAAQAARGDHLVFFSTDGNEDPNDIVPLLKKLREEYDMAVASRFIPGGSDEDADKLFPIRRWGNLFFTWIANCLWNRGPYLTDTLNGFRALSKSAFERINPTASHFTIEFQISIRTMKLGLKVAELPTHEHPRIGGRSTDHTLTTGLALCWTLWNEWRGRHD